MSTKNKGWAIKLTLALTLLILLGTTITLTLTHQQNITGFGEEKPKPPTTGSGGSGGAGNTTGSVEDLGVKVWVFDPLTSGDTLNPDQGLGEDSFNYFYDRSGIDKESSNAPLVKQACANAFTDLHNQGIPREQGRVIAVLWTSFKGNGVGQWDDVDARNKAANDALQMEIPNLPSQYYGETYKNTGHSYRQEVVTRLLNEYRGTASCVVVGDDFPEVGYKISVGTRAQVKKNDGDWLQVHEDGGVTSDIDTPRSDFIHVSKTEGGNVDETLSYTSELAGPGISGSCRKEGNFHFTGDVVFKTEDFTPENCGIAGGRWLDGVYKFKITIPKQGNLKEGVVWNYDAHTKESFEHVIPKTNKAWFRVGDGIPEDPNWTNNVGADGKTFLPGDPIGSVVNFTLGAIESKIILEDDYSENADKIDFTKADVRVLENGRNVTNIPPINLGIPAHKKSPSAISKGFPSIKKLLVFLATSFQ